MALPRDPRFPDRPTHPDFELLSETVCANDNMSEFGSEMIPAIIGTFADPESVEYMVVQRAIGFCQRRGLAPTMENVAMLAACIIDGFTMGAGFERRKQEQANA